MDWIRCLVKLNGMSVNESWYDKLPVLEMDDIDTCEALLCHGVLDEMTGDIVRHEDDCASRPDCE